MDLTQIKAIAQEAREDYRYLHRHPEISGKEIETAAYLKNAVEKLGYLVTCYDNHGLHADLQGTGEGPTVALRADMDALPIEEQTGLPHSSEVPGLMHACGHDMHMAILLGTARYFSENRDFPGRIRLIFQPNEEKDGGAEIMVQSGVMDGVDYCFGLHVSPHIDTGKIGVLAGFMYAGVEDFNITLTGRGGHAANPELAIDPIVCGGHLIVALQTIVSRRLSPFTPAVVTIGSVSSGNKHNIIPDTMTLEGTIRADTRENLNILRNSVIDIAENIASAHHCQCTVDIIKGYIPLINDKDATDAATYAIKKVLGEDAVFILPCPTMGAEDFAYYLEKAPGTFINLGVKAPKEKSHAIHTPYFCPDQSAIYFGIAAEVASTLHYLNFSIKKGPLY